MDLRSIWNDIKTSKVDSHLGTIVTEEQFAKENPSGAARLT